MFRYAIFDFDGTLLDSNQKISFDTKKKIQELAKKGIPFVLASSRLESGVFPVMEELGIKAPAISYSGALVHDADRKVIQSLEMSVQTAEDIHAFVIKTDKSMAAEKFFYEKQEKWNESAPYIYKKSIFFWSGVDTSRRDGSGY